MAIHIPKGEGIKIIKQYSEATTNDSIYILPIDGKYAEMIIVDKVGGKRKVGFSLPENLALHDIVNSDGEITTQGNTYLKTQIDTLLNIEKTTREQADISLDGKIDNLKSIVESLSDWKNLMVNEDADAIINTITEIVSAFRNLPEGSNVLELLNAKVNISSIVNNLESEIENVPLSAKQGKILKDLINDTKTLLEQSNTTQDTAIAGKLDKTTTTIIEPNENFKYAYLTNEANETRRMLAGDLGKNVANSKPTSVAGAGLNMGAIWDIDTNGFPLRIKGLQNKKSDPTHNLKVKMNAYGELSVSDEMDAVINLPDSLNYSTGTPNFNINITKIEQTITAPSNPNFSTEIKEIMANLFDYELTPYSAEDYGIVGRSDLTIGANGYLNKIPQKLVTNKTYDANSDFVVKIENISSSCGWVTGIRREDTLNTDEYVRGGDCHTRYAVGYYIKKQNILFFIGYRGNGHWDTAIWNIPVELGYIKFMISANKVSYKILD